MRQSREDYILKIRLFLERHAGENTVVGDTCNEVLEDTCAGELDMPHKLIDYLEYLAILKPEFEYGAAKTIKLFKND